MPTAIAPDALIPPWPTADLWREANDAVSFMLRQWAGRITGARQLARCIRWRLETLDRPMAALCRATCPSCADVCCLRATVWYDFKDLIYLHLCGETIPPAQLIEARGKSCRYLSAGGCVLPRPQRPFVCTWYLCPEQKSLMRQPSGAGTERIINSLEMIKADRHRLENRLIEAIDGCCGKPGSRSTRRMNR